MCMYMAQSMGTNPCEKKENMYMHACTLSPSLSLYIYIYKWMVLNNILYVWAASNFFPGAERTLAGDTDQDHDASLEISLKQPLLKNGWRTGAATPLKKAQLDVEQQKESFRLRINQLIVDIESAYWRLALAQADLIIKRRSQEIAQQQFEDTRENIRRGILAPSEIFVVEENLVRFQQQVSHQFFPRNGSN